MSDNASAPAAAPAPAGPTGAEPPEPSEPTRSETFLREMLASSWLVTTLAIVLALVISGVLIAAADPTAVLTSGRGAVAATVIRARVSRLSTCPSVRVRRARDGFFIDRTPECSLTWRTEVRRRRSISQEALCQTTTMDTDHAERRRRPCPRRDVAADKYR